MKGALKQRRRDRRKEETTRQGLQLEVQKTMGTLFKWIGRSEEMDIASSNVENTDQKTRTMGQLQCLLTALAVKQVKDGDPEVTGKRRRQRVLTRRLVHEREARAT